ncbi:MAG: TonB family protein, partial [Terracidiphilus sp.]
IVDEASQAPSSPPSVAIESVTPLPISPDLPKYPPIAIAARIEGVVNASFDINAGGNAQNIVFADEGRLKMLEGAVSDTLSKWSFPKPEWGTSGKVAIRFALNCHDDSH